jgi:hypothetical protein
MAYTISLAECEIWVKDFFKSVVPEEEAAKLHGLLWACENWVDVPIAMSVETTRDGVLVTPLEWSQQKAFKPNQVYGLPIEQLISVFDGTIDEVVEKFRVKAGSDSVANNATSRHVFHWGTLLKLNWGLLGYAPGGVEHYLFPTGTRGVHFEFLQANWDDLIIKPHAMRSNAIAGARS